MEPGKSSGSGDKRRRKANRALITAISTSSLSRAAAGEAYDWLDGHILVLSPLTSAPFASHQERVMRMFIDIHNHHDYDRMEGFMATSASNDFLMTAQFGHHPDVPTLDPLRFLFGPPGSGRADFLYRYQSMIAIAPDACFQLGHGQVKQLTLDSYIWSSPVTFHATIVMRLPLPVDLAGRIVDGSGLSEGDVAVVKQALDRLGTYQDYCPLTLSSALLPPPPPEAHFHITPTEQPMPSANANENVVLERLNAFLITNASHDPSLILQTCCLPTRVQGILHAYFQDGLIVRIEFDYFETP